MNKNNSKINLENKWFYFLITIMLLLVLNLGVWAYHSGESPSVFGHSEEEIEVNINGNTMTLKDALNNGKIKEKVLLDNPIVLFSGARGGQGIIDRSDKNLQKQGLPPNTKEILLYGSLDSSDEANSIISYRYPGKGGWKTLVSSKYSAKYPNSNSVWIPLDKDGKLEWDVNTQGGAGIQEYTLEIQGYVAE